MHSPHWLQIAQALSSFTNLPFPPTAMGTAPLLSQAGIRCTILSDISTMLDPWVASAPGTLPSPPALSPKTHQPQPNIPSVTAVQGWGQSPACVAAFPPTQEQKGTGQNRKELKRELSQYKHRNSKNRSGET